MKTPRPYQTEGIEQIYTAWQESPIAMFVLATGMGKTFTSSCVIKDHLSGGKRTLFLAHRTELIMQTRETLRIEGVPSGIIMGGTKTDYSIPSQVGSVQTVVKRKGLPEFDLIVIDEGHHVAEDNSYYKIVQRFPNAKVLILTATPYRLSGKGFKNVFKHAETKLILNMPLDKGIDDGWLVPLKYFVGSTPDRSKISLVNGDYNEDDAKKEMEFAPIVETYLENAKGLQGLCFCVNVAHSKEVAQKYNDAGISAVHIDGTTPTELRAEYLEAFKRREILVVCNVGIFTEGTDFPNCEFVQLARLTKSLSLYLQMVGRGTRATPGVVDKYQTAEERKQAINESQKPYCKVLDNAGCWQDHGFPWQERDWQSYFIGYNKKKKKAKEETFAEEFIEVYEYEEPTTGIRRRTKNIKELDGMILVEVTKEYIELATNNNAIREFHKLYATIKRNARKPEAKIGMATYMGFLDYCTKNNIVITRTMWGEIGEVLVKSIENKVAEYVQRLNEPVIHELDPYIKDLKRYGVPRTFLTKQYQNYSQQYKQKFGQMLPS